MAKIAIRIIAGLLIFVVLLTGSLMELLSSSPANILSAELQLLKASLGFQFSGGYGWNKPCEYLRISCEYGPRIHPITKEYGSHNGVDLANASGTPIYAAKSGTVILATYNSVYGYHVKIDHGDGYITLYGHMTEYVVSSGQEVSGGQLIGYMGSTGWSTGPHLHFTIYYNGETVDPMNYISDAALAQNNVEGQIYNYLTSTLGLSKAAACGILANIEAESDFNVAALGDNGTSYGLCQWHNTRAGVGRWTNLINYCSANGLDSTTLEGQLEFIRHELETVYPSLLRDLQTIPNSADGAYDAGYLWCTKYESPADEEVKGNIRGNLARNTYWTKYD